MASSDFASGALVRDGRYRIERRLGSGGMASVWLAHDEELDRAVAIKVISDTLALDESYLARFRREARIAAGLTHPNLVKIYDFAEDAERPFLVMELVDGGTLADRPALDLDALDLARSLLSALDHVHRSGVVHRDVKPANVLFGRDGRPRLTDFGIAHPEDATSLTQTGQIIGTLRYMAPEVAAGQPATPVSDLYALGVVLDGVARDDPRLRPLIAAVTAEDPAQRPANATAALALLDAPPPPPPGVRTGRGSGTAPTRVLQRREPPLERVQAWMSGLGRGERVGIGVGAAVALTLLFGLLTMDSGGGLAADARELRAERAEAVARSPAIARDDAPLGEQLDALEEAVGRSRQP